jgi:hypothetical protein
MENQVWLGVIECIVRVILIFDGVSCFGSKIEMLIFILVAQLLQLK